MQIRRLLLANFRILKSLEITFNPGMNLIIGVNGVGKSAIVDALRSALSRIINDISKSNNSVININHGDFHYRQLSLSVELDLVVNSSNFKYTLQRNRTRNKDRSYSNIKSVNEWAGRSPNSGDLSYRPLGIYFSTGRSIITQRQLPPSGNVLHLAFQRSLLDRMTNINSIAYWIDSMKTLSVEYEASGDIEGAERFERQIESIDNSIKRFIKDYEKIIIKKQTVGSNIIRSISIKKSSGTFSIGLLSDGERSILNLILEISYRLASANRDLPDPILGGKGIILIDELDLHLHPQWQREIVGILTEVFPNCQFIATTHSPLILGSVQPEELIILEKTSKGVISRPGKKSYGHDVNTILSDVMGTPERNEESMILIEQIENEIEDSNFESAREKISELRKILRGEDDETIGLEASLNTLEAITES